MNNIKKNILIALFLIAPFNILNAAEVLMVSSNNNPGIGEEFYVDVILRTESANINGIEGSISFDDSAVSFIRSENGKSFINYWIENPKIQSSGKIFFSGIVPNGFSGFLNEQDNENAGTGNITRLVFSGKKTGSSSIVLDNSLVTVNNGEGSILNLPVSRYVINISDVNNPTKYNLIDLNSPELTAQIVTDENLYQGAKTLVFNAIDKESGISGVYVKIKGDWVEIDNPFSLPQSGIKGILTVKAVDFSGNISVKRFFLPGYGRNSFVALIVILLISSFFGIRFLYYTYAKNKI